MHLLFSQRCCFVGSVAEAKEELTEEQQEMMNVMGFTDFISSKVMSAIFIGFVHL